MKYSKLILFFTFFALSEFELLANNPIVQVHRENFKKVVEEFQLPVFVTISATWCPNCKKLISQMSNLPDEFKDRCVFTTIDVDVDNEMLQELLQDIFKKKYQIIGGFPALLTFYKGDYQGYILGFFATEQDLAKKIDEVLVELVN